MSISWGETARPKDNAPHQATYEKRGRVWAVRDCAGDLIALVVYKRGAAEVCRRLNREV